MEFVTLATTVALVFLIFANIHIDKNKNFMVAGPGSHKTTTKNNASGPVKLNLIPVDSNDLHSSQEDLFPVAEGHSSTNYDKLIPYLREMVLLAGGDIATKEYARESGNIDAITVKIPSGSYNSFIRRVERIGRFNPPAPPLKDQSLDPVLLRISLNLSE
jgi:hypothetical protein